MRPFESPGWILIPPDRHHEFEPLQQHDEVWTALGGDGWSVTINFIEHSPSVSRFSEEMFYRRRTDLCTPEQLGEPCEDAEEL